VKDSDILGQPITGVRYHDRQYTFYPYAGRMVSPKGGLLGFINTAKGKLHGRFYTKGQWFLFEPAPEGNEPLLAHYTVEEVVDNLLETDYNDFSELEKPEHWEEVPFGFSAQHGTDRLEAKWDAKAKGYRLIRYWTDPYTQQPRQLDGGLQRVTNPTSYLAREQTKFEAEGWTFKLL